jgi:hypothetical protein
MDLLEQVLSRLGLSERPEPTLDGLQTLYAAWCRKVPFDSETPPLMPGGTRFEFTGEDQIESSLHDHAHPRSALNIAVLGTLPSRGAPASGCT